MPNFEKSLAIFEVVFGKIIDNSWADFCNWSDFKCHKLLNIEQRINASGQTGWEPYWQLTVNLMMQSNVLLNVNGHMLYLGYFTGEFLTHFMVMELKPLLC